MELKHLPKTRNLTDPYNYCHPRCLISEIEGHNPKPPAAPRGSSYRGAQYLGGSTTTKATKPEPPKKSSPNQLPKIKFPLPTKSLMFSSPLISHTNPEI